MLLFLCSISSGHGIPSFCETYFMWFIGDELTHSDTGMQGCEPAWATRAPHLPSCNYWCKDWFMA